MKRRTVKRVFKKTMFSSAAAVILLGSGVSAILPLMKIVNVQADAANPIVAGNVIQDHKLKYTVIDSKSVKVTGPRDGVSLKGTLEIPETVKVGSQVFNVTEVADDAFVIPNDDPDKITSKIPEVTKLIVPATITKVGINAIRNATNLSEIVLKGKLPELPGGKAELEVFHNIAKTGTFYYSDDVTTSLTNEEIEKIQKFVTEMNQTFQSEGYKWTAEPMNDNSSYGEGEYSVTFENNDILDDNDDGSTTDDATGKTDTLEFAAMPDFKFRTSNDLEAEIVGVSRTGSSKQPITVRDQREHKVFGANDGFSVFARVKEFTDQGVGLTSFTIATDNSDTDGTTGPDPSDYSYLDVKGTDQNNNGDGNDSGEQISILGDFGKIATGGKNIKPGDRSTGDVKAKIKVDEDSLKENGEGSKISGKIEYVLTNSSDNELPDLVPYHEQTEGEYSPVQPNQMAIQWLDLKKENQGVSSEKNLKETDTKPKFNFKDELTKILEDGKSDEEKKKIFRQGIIKDGQFLDKETIQDAKDHSDGTELNGGNDTVLINTGNLDSLEEAFFFNSLSGKVKIYSDTPRVTNMSWMFSSSSSLTKLDLSNFNTQNVKNMRGMFLNCSDLNKLDLSNFDTKNVQNMSQMFFECSKLNKLDLSNFNTQKVIDMNEMFYYCSSLPELDLSNFNTKKVTDMNEMFSECSKLNKLDLSSFNTQEVIDMSRMFFNCSGLNKLDLNSFNTQKVEYMNWMFFNCSSLTELDLNKFAITSALKTALNSNMFYGVNTSELKIKHNNNQYNFEAFKYYVENYQI